ncbi:flavin reductase [Labrys wisconsinensis]|uniref:FMN reductase (NADH) RutF n=1 Tax=Labrys wisconsinensis TaxID=425677 RepID=A0ABU0JAZ3_9HYPH|nr:flavin reductase [Labrys wisconsinensis]MDQ0471447.1 flavin reductase [Labrys wisconsinensis]
MARHRNTADEPEAGPWPAVPQQSYRDAMSRVGAAVNVVTTDGPGGRAGFTASAVCSVTDTPPTLLVCLNRGSSVSAAFAGNGVLCVNTLAAEHQPLSALFGGRTPMDERFAAADWTEATTGAPVLVGAVASFDCRVVRTAEVGTHAVLFCEVVGLTQGTVHEGLIYFGRRYHKVHAEQASA